MCQISNKLSITGIACVMSMLVLSPVRAEDIDLFTTQGTQSAPPNVYIMIDNSANWNAKIGGIPKKDMEHDALRQVFVDDTDLAGAESDGSQGAVRINIGFGVFAAGNSPKGGKVVEALEPLTLTRQTDELAPLFTDPNTGADNLPGTNNAPYALSFNEAVAYFGGETPVAGTQDGDHDPEAIAPNGDYQIPVSSDVCGKNYVILIANGEPDSGEDNDAEAKLDARGGVLDSHPIDIIDDDDFESNWSDEFAQYMKGANVVPEDVRGNFEQNVRTYVIDVFDPGSAQAGDPLVEEDGTNKFESARDFLESTAIAGGGERFEASSASEIKDALIQILDELFAVDSVFAATTLPVSVNVRGTNLNQVYMGVFRPSEVDQTRWPGNLKLYQLAVDDATNTLFLADANGEAAQSSTTGFIVNDAESFWTTSSTYWEEDPSGTPQSASDLPDGAVVEKGGVHQQIRDDYPTDTSTRPLFTRTSGQCSILSGLSNRGCAFDDFDFTSNSEVNQTTLGTVDATEAELLVDWVHGANNVSGDSLITKTPRPSVHGDVLHSRPAVINYGDTDGDGESEVFVFYGANDGIIHAVRGGKTGTEAGHEQWGFIPQEFFSKLKSLRDKDAGKTYFSDGGIAIFQEDNDEDGVIEEADNDRVYLYVAMRRGGRFIYALNVTDPTDPRFMWKIDSDASSDSSVTIEELGQSWSQPNLSEISYVDSLGNTVTNEVLIFGGGYDPGADDKDGTAARSMGRGIYIVDAEDGSLIWSAGDNGSGATVTHNDMDYSIPSDVTVIDRDGSGFDDRVYVGDTGGQVWRVDISGAPSAWTLNKIASIGIEAGLEERKFLFPPDVVFTDDNFDAVLIGTGDRTDPFKTSVTNRFYMFKDTNTALSVDGSWSEINESDLFDATDNLIQVGTDSEQATAESELANARGWMLTLNAGGSNSGEKVVSSSVTLGGAVFFNTNEPPDTSVSTNDCEQNLGVARFYEVNFETGAAILENNSVEGLQTEDRYSEAAGGGFPPSPVPVIVEIDGKKYQSVISGTEVSDPPGAKLERRSPVYWDTNIDN